MTIYNSSFNDKTGYVFNDDGSVKVVLKATGKEVEGVTFDEQKVLEDAAKACIKNDVYIPEVKVECSCNSYCGDHNCICQSESCEECKEELVVADDIKHQLGAKDFGEYLIVIGDYTEKDFDVFVGTKAELNDHIAELHLHQTPKVYILKQLPVRTKYEVL